MTPRRGTWWLWPAIFVAAIGAGFGLGHATRPSVERVAAEGERFAGAREEASARPPQGARPAGRRAEVPSNPLLVPGTADHDPAAAALALELAPRDVFAAEKRDPAFALRRERFLHDHFAAVIQRHAPGVEVTGIECRAGSCRAVFEAPDDGWSPELVKMIAWGSVTGTEEIDRVGGVVSFEVTALMNHELLDHDTYERYLSDWRRDIERDFDRLREQRSGDRP